MGAGPSLIRLESAAALGMATGAAASVRRSDRTRGAYLSKRADRNSLELDDWRYAAVGDRAIIYALGEVTLAERVTVSQGAHLCAGTHDYRDPAMPLLKPPIVIDRDAWICADAFIGPGVRVGSRAIVGARCVVTKDVEPGAIMIGNPATLLRRRADGAV